MSYKDDLQKTLDLLKRERDEIGLKLHLGQKDLQDEMETFDKQWEDFKNRGEKALAAADESSEDVVLPNGLKEIWFTRCEKISQVLRCKGSNDLHSLWTSGSSMSADEWAAI